MNFPKEDLGLVFAKKSVTRSSSSFFELKTADANINASGHQPSQLLLLFIQLKYLSRMFPHSYVHTYSLPLLTIFLQPQSP